MNATEKLSLIGRQDIEGASKNPNNYKARLVFAVTAELRGNRG